MKLCNFLLLLFMVEVISNPIFCSQERARQLVMHQNNVDEVYNLQVNIQILGEQFNSFVDVFVDIGSEISDQAESQGYHWEPSYLVDQRYNEIAFEQIALENNITRQEEHAAMIDLQRFGVQFINFLIWGLRD